MNANDIFTNRIVQTATVGVLAFAAGASGGYIFGKRKAAASPPEHEEQMSFVFETVDEDGEAVAYEVVDAEVETVEVEVEAETETETVEYDTTPPVIQPLGADEADTTIEWIGPDPREMAEDISNVFDAVGEWDEEAELAKRSSDEPYIITIGEFLENDTGFTQTDLTFYTEDEQVVDDHDVPVYNWADVLGLDNLKFGHGSTSADTVYIRNVQRKAEFQVIQIEGSYAKEKLGLEAETDLENELRHSEPRRFRMQE